jgi:hypothetical protein
MQEAQKKFLEDRQDGFYMPMVNSVQLADGDIVPANKPTKPAGTSGGRPLGNSGTPKAKSAAFSIQAIKTTVDKVGGLFSCLEASFKKQYNLKKIGAEQKSLLESLAARIVSSKESGEWEDSALRVAADPDLLLSFSLLNGVEAIAAEHNLGEYAAALLYHSTKQPE